jgi:hypothetical protein
MMAAGAAELSRACLLVEGKDDCHVALAIYNRYCPPKQLDIRDCKGRDKVLDKLEALFADSNAPRAIGILVDAEDNPEAFWASAREKLKEYEYDVPLPRPREAAFFSTPRPLPPVTVWIMPDNHRPGALEDLVREMMPREACQYVEKTVAQAQQDGVTTFKDPHWSKAIVHTYLAWQDEPGKPMGISITNANLQPEQCPAAQLLAKWLDTLFSL